MATGLGRNGLHRTFLGKRHPAVVLCVLLAAVGAGCGDAAKNDTQADAKASPAVRSEDAGGLRNAKGAVTSLEGFTCSADAHGVWSGHGKLVNDTAAQATYLVSVSVVRDKTYDVLGTKEQYFDLDAGQKVKVAFAKVYAGAKTKNTKGPKPSKAKKPRPGAKQKKPNVQPSNRQPKLTQAPQGNSKPFTPQAPDLLCVPRVVVGKRAP